MSLILFLRSVSKPAAHSVNAALIADTEKVLHQKRLRLARIRADLFFAGTAESPEEYRKWGRLEQERESLIDEVVMIECLIARLKGGV